MEIKVNKNLYLGAAVSGGVDSMVMLELLLQAGAKVAVINVDHSIRGEVSANDSAFVKAYCAQRGLPFFYRKVDALAYAAKNKISTELAARELRYEFFDELLAQGKVDVVALAHHLDDQAETILMHFLRGSGVRGLRGIGDRRGYIHPLLGYGKDQIIAFAEACALPFVQDDTNFDTAYRRNFIRHEVLPLLRTAYPDINTVLSKNAQIFAELESYLTSEITPYNTEPDGISLPIEVLDRHPAIAKKSVVEALGAMGIKKDIEFAHLQSVIGLKDAANNARLNLPFGADVIREYDKLHFVLRQELAPYEQPFNTDGRYLYGGKVYTFVASDSITKGASFDPDKLPTDAVVRTRRQGDVFRRYKGGQKSLSDYLTDIKMPLSERNKVLVLAAGSCVYAVLGVEISDEVKIDKNTKNIIKVVTYKGEN